ncbi:phage terminase large subunit [Arenimonas alkanexedens]
MDSRPVSFLTFFILWARVKGWDVPLLHVRICEWLEHCDSRVRVLLVFRGAAKSTIYACYKAWKLYRNREWRSLIYAADDKLAGKLTRDTINVLRRHPLCGGMLPSKPGALSFWVNGSDDPRNPSMEAVGVSSNATGSRADAADFDDIEVPKNIKTAEARENLRNKIDDVTHILVPGWQKTFVGTPHTHDSIYTEQTNGGAAVLKIPLFDKVARYEQTDTRTRYRFDFPLTEDGLYVMVGIHKPAKLLVEGRDYRVEGREVVFSQPPRAVLDICTGCAWPERFTREEIELKRKETRTLNGWDSQYQLEAKPVSEVRLDPAKIIPYDVEPEIREANNAVGMFLSGIQMAGAALRWDPASGKLRSDKSCAALVLQDVMGRRYIHRVVALTGQVAEFDEHAKRIIGGQVFQLCDLVAQFGLTKVEVETNGIGGFAPAVLKAALKQRKLQCGVKEIQSIVNKNARILEEFEPLLLSAGQLWAHVSVLNGDFWDQMKDWNPATQNQDDDDLDATAGALGATPERVGRIVGNPTATPREDWRPEAGVHEVVLDLG